MKKIIVLLVLSFLLTSCFGEKEKELKVETKTSFDNPKNNLEEEINAREAFLEPNSSRDEKLDLVKSYLRYGDAYYIENTFANKALEILNKMPEEFIVEYLKGYAYEIQTNYEQALAQYNKLFLQKNKSNENKILLLNQIGHVYDLQGDLKKANKYYLQAEDLDLENVKTLVNRGRYEIRVGNNENAEKYFSRVLEKTKIEHLKSEMHYNLSTIEQNKNNLDKAIEYAKKGIEEDKDYPNNYLSLGVSIFMKGGDNIEDTVKYLQKSIELYPNNSQAYKYLGIYYYTKDNFDKAIESFEKQVEVSKNDILLMANDKEGMKVSGNYDLARTYALKGNVDNSIKYLNKALDGKNKPLFYSFLGDISREDGPFVKISTNDSYKDEIKKIILKYNKK